MVNKDEQFIIEETRKRINSIMEYTVPTYGGVREEDNEDPNAMPPVDGGNEMPPMDGGAEQGGEMPMDGSMPQMGGDAQQGGEIPPMDGGAEQGGPQGFDPQVGPNQEGGEMPMDGGMAPEGGEMGPDDEVVDITDLTDAQEEMADTQDELTKNIEGLDKKFTMVMKSIGEFEELMRQNDAKIEDLKAEIEKRNPTQIEKLGLQTTHSYPFSQTVDDFWKEKEATSNYSTEPDDNGKEQGQYVITKDDVDGNVDWKGIADSINDDDLIYNQNLANILKY